MLINDNRDRQKHVVFVGYTGKWPLLCSGVLTLKINGEQHTFGNQGPFGQKTPDGHEPDHPKFWKSGGECRMPPNPVITDEWLIDVDALPEELRQYAAEIDSVFNTNIAHGCCGGCR